MKSDEARPARWARVGSIAGLTAVFLIILGARLWLVDRYGSAVPYLDQWNGEAEMVLVPWLNGTLRPADLLIPHNEHRLLLSRLETLALFVANRQWDPQLEAVCNAIFQAASLTFLAGICLRLVSPRTSPIVLGCFILMGALPIGWENTLVGFQSQVYFLLLFSMVALLGLGTCTALTVGWWAGLAAGVLACFAQASGFFAMVCVLGFLIFQLAPARFQLIDRASLPTIFVCVAFIAIAFLTRTEVPGHAVLRAQSLASFVVALGQCLAWPWVDRPWLAALIYLPWIGLLCRSVSRNNSPTSKPGPDHAVLLVGAWVILQAAAMAWARGGLGTGPASRYTDVLALGLIANVCALLRWIESRERRSLSRWIATALAVVWLGSLFVGVVADSRDNLSGSIPAFRDMVKSQESLVRDYVRKGDAALLREKSFPEIPYPDPALILRLLEIVVLREILPASLRVPLPCASLARSAALEGELPPQVDKWIEIAARDFWIARPNVSGNAQNLEVAFENPGRLPFVACLAAGSPDSRHTRLEAIQTGSAALVFHATAQHASWRNISFAGTANHLQMRASTSGGNHWIAFTQPVELGRLSHWSNVLRRKWRPLMITGTALLAAAFLLKFPVRRHLDSPA